MTHHFDASRGTHPRRSRAEAFWYSRRRGLMTTVRWSVPAFLLRTPGGTHRFGSLVLRHHTLTLGIMC
jgi:phage I-like protein